MPALNRLPSHRLRGARIAILASAALAGPAMAAPEAAARPDAEALQAWLHKDIERTAPFPIFPLADRSEPSRRFAHDLLDALWQEPAYRQRLTTWLGQRPDETADETLAEWHRHYHRSFKDAVEFLDDNTVRHLWRLEGRNAIHTFDRTRCNTISDADLRAWIGAAQQTYLQSQATVLPQALATALGREFRRQDKPRPGDRPVGAAIMPVVMSSFQALRASLPAEDGARLQEAYSYRQQPTPVTPAEACHRSWVVARAVEDSTLDTPQVSAPMLRSSMTSSAYAQAFARFDAQGEAGRPTPGGFRPGKAVLTVPRLPFTLGVSGNTTIRIAIDDTGRVSETALVADTLSARTVAGIDGRDVTTGPLYLAAVERYLRDGQFPVREKEGKPVPYVVTLPMNW